MKQVRTRILLKKQDLAGFSWVSFKHFSHFRYYYNLVSNWKLFNFRHFNVYSKVEKRNIRKLSTIYPFVLLLHLVLRIFFVSKSTDRKISLIKTIFAKHFGHCCCSFCQSISNLSRNSEYISFKKKTRHMLKSES